MVRRSEAEPVVEHDHHHGQQAKPIDMVLIITHRPLPTRATATTMKPIPICDTITYVLRLDGDNYYVGMTSNLHSRLSSHFNGTGAQWTQKHQPIEVVALVSTDREEELTIRAMATFGPERVRGHHVSAVEYKNMRYLKRGFKCLEGQRPPKTWNVFQDRVTTYLNQL
jgi:predicted GIY-YIG superfamily endonuclease